MTDTTGGSGDPVQVLTHEANNPCDTRLAEAPSTELWRGLHHLVEGDAARSLFDIAAMMARPVSDKDARN